MDIKQTVKVTIKGTDCEVKIPNVSQSLKIEELKMDLTGGKYPEMARSGLISHNYNLDLVDAISIFSVLIPDLKKMLGVESYELMDMFTGKELVLAYRNQYSPFYKEFITALYEGLDTDESK